MITGSLAGAAWLDVVFRDPRSVCEYDNLMVLHTVFRLASCFFDYKREEHTEALEDGAALEQYHCQGQFPTSTVDFPSKQTNLRLLYNKAFGGHVARFRNTRN